MDGLIGEAMCLPVGTWGFPEPKSAVVHLRAISRSADWVCKDGNVGRLNLRTLRAVRVNATLGRYVSPRRPHWIVESIRGRGNRNWRVGMDGMDVECTSLLSHYLGGKCFVRQGGTGVGMF